MRRDGSDQTAPSSEKFLRAKDFKARPGRPAGRSVGRLAGRGAQSNHSGWDKARRWERTEEGKRQTSKFHRGAALARARTLVLRVLSFGLAAYSLTHRSLRALVYTRIFLFSFFLLFFFVRFIGAACSIRISFESCHFVPPFRSSSLSLSDLKTRYLSGL